MADASSVRKSLSATTLPTPLGRSASSIRYINNELQLATGTQWAPQGRLIFNEPLTAVAGTTTVPCYVCDRAYQLVAAYVSAETASTAGTPPTIQVVKATDGTQLSAGTAMTAAVDLKAITPAVAANLALSGTAANTKTAGPAATWPTSGAAGDRIGYTITNAATGLVGGQLTMIFKAV